MLRWLVCAVFLWSASLAYAQERVSLTFDPSIDSRLAAKLESAIRGQLADAGSIVSRDETCRVLVSCANGSLSLRFQDAAGRVVGGARPLSLQSEELAASEAGTMVRAFVLSRLPAEVPPVEDAAPVVAPPPVVAPTPVVPRAFADELEVAPVRAPSRWRASVFYTGNSYAKELRWQQGVRGELAMYLGQWLQVGAGYTYHAPVDLTLARTQIRFRDHNVSLLAGVGRSGTRVGLAGELVVGLTDTKRQTLNAAAGVAASDDARRIGANLALRVRGRLRVISRLWLELAPALEVALAQRDFVARTDVETSISPYVARGRLDLGASFELP